MAGQATNSQQLMEEVHQPDSGHGGSRNPLLSLDPGMSVWFWLVFAVFIFVLWKAAWKLVSNMLNERQEGIQKALDEAEAARKSLNEAADTQRKLIEEGKQRAAEITQRAEESSQKLADDIRERAREEAEKMVEGARIQIERQKEKAISELQSEIVDLAVSVATRLIKENLDDRANQKLVDDYIKEISA